MIHLLYTLPIIGLLILVLRKQSLRITQGVLTILAILEIIVTYICNINILYPIICLLIGELIHFSIVGLLGKKTSLKNHQVILIAISLFPWFINFKVSVFYILASIISTIIIYYAYVRYESKNYNISSFSRNKVINSLSQADALDYLRNTHISLSSSFIISTTCTAIFGIILWLV